MTDVLIAGRRIGRDHPALLIAEVGINHNGDMALARRSIAAAAAAGADVVKFQNYRTEDFVQDPTLTLEYPGPNGQIVERQVDLFKRCELQPGQLGLLAECAREHGVMFMSTPTSAEGVRDIVHAGGPALKNGSDYLGHLPLIEDMARTGLPTILSTGMATMADIDRAVTAYRAARGQGLVLLHCVSSYPAPMQDVNLRRIPALAAVFGCPVGFSDHTEGTTAALGAIALGACVIEKHFTLDRSLVGPDHRFSSDPAEFTALVKAVRGLEAALGESAVKPTAAEERGRREYRLSCIAARDLRTGDRVRPTDLVFRRPGTGLAPHLAGLIVGRRLARDVPSGHVIQAEDLG